jgi:hypothetical protein
MASLVVRKLDAELVARLKERARAHGRSAEAEHREILEEALRPQMTGEEFLRTIRGDWPRFDEGFLESLEQFRSTAKIPDLGE